MSVIANLQVHLQVLQLHRELNVSRCRIVVLLVREQSRCFFITKFAKFASNYATRVVRADYRKTIGIARRRREERNSPLIGDVLLLSLVGSLLINQRTMQLLKTIPLSGTRDDLPAPSNISAQKKEEKKKEEERKYLLGDGLFFVLPNPAKLSRD